MKNMMRLLALLILIAAISIVTPPSIAESWQTRYGTNSLQLGSNSIYVRHMQEDLNAVGYAIAVDGTFDSNTQTAVKRFQRQHGLTASGVFDISAKIVLWNATH